MSLSLVGGRAVAGRVQSQGMESQFGGADEVELFPNIHVVMELRRARPLETGKCVVLCDAAIWGGRCQSGRNRGEARVVRS